MAELRTITFKTDQAILTGETNPINKIVDTVNKDNASIQDRINYLFSGTLVNNGTALGLVVGTGMTTEIGII